MNANEDKAYNQALEYLRQYKDNRLEAMEQVIWQKRRSVDPDHWDSVKHYLVVFFRQEDEKKARTGGGAMALKPFDLDAQHIAQYYFLEPREKALSTIRELRDISTVPEFWDKVERILKEHHSILDSGISRRGWTPRP